MQDDNKDKKPIRKCEECCTGKHKCFVCNEHTSEVVKCCEKKCGKFYHLKCLKDQNYPLEILDETKNKFRCPLHFCLTCYNEHREDSVVRTVKKKLIFCIYCPTAYHWLDSCIAAGACSIDSDHLVCPEHKHTPTDSITTSSKKKKKRSKAKHVNISWCFSCNLGGELVCCEKCPAAYHKDCIIEDEGKPPNDDHYYRMDCVNRKQLHYDDIIWVKLASFRWWPAQIKHPVNVPDTILRRDFSNGEFPVLFFGTNDYYWINKSKAFLYMEGDDKKKITTHGKGLDKQFKKAMEEVVIAYENYKQNKTKIFQSKTIHPTPYFHLKVNKPFGKCQQAFVDMDKSNKQSCDCKEEDPCASDENCLNRLLMYECDSSICKNQDKCKNQRFKKREYAKTEKFRSQAGWGLRALEDIKKGQFVIEYVGELIDEEECNKRLNEMVLSNDKNFYFLTIDKETIIDAGPKGNLARFMNHSCDPNCETQKWVVNNQIRVGLFAVRDIPNGSELTFNYNLECRGNEKTKCLCNSKNCSGFIGDRPNKIREEKQQKETTKKRKISSKPAYAALHEDYCFRCGEAGKLVMCDSKEKGLYCPRSYCLPCLNLEKIPHGKWFCPVHHCDICGNKATKFCDHCPTSFCNEHDNKGFRSLPNGELICNDHSDEYYKDAKSKASKKSSSAKKTFTDLEVSSNVASKDSQIKIDENSGRIIKKPRRSNVNLQEEVNELRKMDIERKRLNEESRGKRIEERRRKSLMQQKVLESKKEEKNLDELNSNNNDHDDKMDVDNKEISLKITENGIEENNLNKSDDKQVNDSVSIDDESTKNKEEENKLINDKPTELNSSPNKKDKELIVKDKKTNEYSQKENLDKDLPVAKVLSNEICLSELFADNESNESFLSVKANTQINPPQQQNGKILDEQPTVNLVNGTSKQLNNDENENHNHKIAIAQNLNNNELNETAS